MDPAQAFELQESSQHRIINETIQSGKSAVQGFYENAVIFVSGGSGFLGKQLIEKLLRSCNVKKICVLLRPKKQKSVKERLSSLVNDPVFEHLLKMKPDFATKIQIVVGDITELDLGMSAEDWKAVTAEVNVMFHVAATTSFTEPLKKATLTNVRGTREMLKLAKSCKNLRCFVHVSTAYSYAKSSNSNTELLEQFHAAPMQPHMLIDMVEQLDEALLDRITPQLLTDWPNTYSFTKALAEELVRNMAGQMPIVVIRPAIVICALREPNPGWIDPSCVYGASGMIVGVGLGVLRVMRSRPEVHLDYVPVDVVNNATIVAAQVTAQRWKKDQTDIKIYTLTSSRNPCTVRRQKQLLETDARNFSTDKSIWYCFMIQVSSKPLFVLLFWIFQYIPAYIVDGVLLLLRKRPMLRKVYDKAYVLNEALGHYLTNQWKFDDSNLVNMHKNLSPADQIIYNSEIDQINWTKYIILWCIGLRKYILKDGINNTEYACRKQFWLKILHYVVMVLYFYSMYKILVLFCYTLYGLLCFIF